MLGIIIILISLILDGLLTNYLPYLVNDLSLFTPLFTLISISLLYPYYRKKEKEVFIIIFITGFIYDLFYTNLLFINGLLFLLIGYLSKFIYRRYEIDYFKLIIYITLIVVVYESSLVLIILIFNLVPVTLTKLLYKISHSLILNIIYGELLYFILNNLPKKYKKISIN